MVWQRHPTAILLLIAAGAIAPSAACADDRRCVFASAIKLPSIPGITPMVSRSRPGPAPAEAVAVLVSSFGRHANPSQAINAELHVIDAGVLDAVQEEHKKGAHDRVQKILIDAVAPHIVETRFVEIDTRAVGRFATFHFLCLQTKATLIAVPLGMQ